MIEVKRTLTDERCYDGIKNIVAARSHLIQLGDSFDAMKVNSWFGAVVGFEDHTKSDFKAVLRDQVKRAVHEVCPDSSFVQKVSQGLVPHYIGSLGRRMALLDRRNATGVRYRTYESSTEERYISLQYLLIAFLRCHWALFYGKQPQFFIPKFDDNADNLVEIEL